MSESLRDQLEKAYDTHAAETPQDQPAAQTPVPATDGGDGQDPSSVASALADQPKPGRTAGRERDEKGRLLPGPAKRPETQEAAAPEAALAPAPKPHPQRPSSWKKEMWDHWGKLDPSVADYILSRENDYAKGVSTYKSEWEKAKPLLDAVAPFLNDLQQNRIDPAQQIGRYFQLHKDFAFGSPETKLQRFLQLAQDYQVPLQNLFVQGQDGKVYFNQQMMQAAQQQAQQPQQQPQQDVRKVVQELLTEQTMLQQIQAMGADKEKFPHFEVLRESMAGILQAGLAQDLPSAYQAALRLPQHSEIWDAMQQQQREKDAQEKAEAARKAAQVARRNAVSPSTQTPAGAPAGANKGLRAQLSSAFDEHLGGRV